MPRLQGLVDDRRDSPHILGKEVSTIRHKQFAKSRAERRKTPSSSLANQSVIRAFGILRSFYHPDEWVTTRELSQRAGIGEASIERFLPSLVDVGALVRNEEGRYRCIVFVMPGNHGAETGNGHGRDEVRAESRAF